jgi:sec-independent protein translocase protein TatA
MFGLGVTELAIIGGILMVLFGARKLPELGKGIAGFFTSFRREVRELESEIEKGGDE